MPLSGLAFVLVDHSSAAELFQPHLQYIFLEPEHCQTYREQRRRCGTCPVRFYLEEILEAQSYPQSAVEGNLG